MKKTGDGRTINPSGGAGFTLMEVMVAIGILAISLVAIFNVQGSSIMAANRVKNATVAILLARSKMVDIERELIEEGFSDFAENMEGDFEEEGWPDFKWVAEISKVKFPIPSNMPGSSEGNNTYASMMSGYSSMLTDMIGNALRECNLTVTWGGEDEFDNVKISTHFIELGRAGQLEAPTSGVGSLQNKANSLTTATSKSNSLTTSTKSTSGITTK